MNIKSNFILFLISGLLIISCTSSAKNHIYSRELENSDLRVKELQKYFILRSDAQDAEFDIFDVNIGASRSIPGPTGRDYKVALLLTPENAELWTSDVEESSKELDYRWAIKITENNPNFKISSSPEFYIDTNKEVTFFKDEGIVFLRIRQD